MSPIERAVWEGVRAAYEYRHGKGTCPDDRLLDLQEANKVGAWESEVVAGRAAITALRQWLADEELVIVPGEATIEMLLAGESKMADKEVALIHRRKKGEASESETVLDTLYAIDVYEAMLAAFPDPLAMDGEDYED